MTNTIPAPLDWTTQSLAPMAAAVADAIADAIIVDRVGKTAEELINHVGRHIVWGVDESWLSHNTTPEIAALAVKIKAEYEAQAKAANAPWLMSTLRADGRYWGTEYHYASVHQIAPYAIDHAVDCIHDRDNGFISGVESVKIELDDRGGKNQWMLNAIMQDSGDIKINMRYRAGYEIHVPFRAPFMQRTRHDYGPPETLYASTAEAQNALDDWLQIDSRHALEAAVHEIRVAPRFLQISEKGHAAAKARAARLANPPSGGATGAGEVYVLQNFWDRIPAKHPLPTTRYPSRQAALDALAEWCRTACEHNVNPGAYKIRVVRPMWSY